MIIVVDRIDLDSQITSTFLAADAPNLVRANSRQELKQLLAGDVRKIIITTIHQFGEDQEKQAAHRGYQSTLQHHRFS